MADTGKAFEYACLQSLYELLNNGQDIAITENAPLRTAQAAFEQVNIQENMRLAADAATRAIVRLEPRLSEGADRLILSIQADAAGIAGDVRDVLCVRGAGWEIGISCKHNHHAVKHSRLSDTIDFGREWFGRPCSDEYMNTARRIFGELRHMRDTRPGCRWDSIEDKAGQYYRPVLDAFMTEMRRLDAERSVAAALVQYLIGREDFYKVITDDRGRFTRIEAMNINGTLNQAGQTAPMTRVPLLRLPTRIYDIDYKEGSDNTVHVVCDQGWGISMRIHNASSRIEPSLKFDVQLISIPGSIYAQAEPWE